jgi:hypothetical protein
MKQQDALLELSMLNAESTEYDFTDVKVKCIKNGIPIEIITRMENLWQTTKLIAGEIVAIGKIIVMKIYDFVVANTHLAMGMALGVSLGAIIAIIPIFGPLLSPLVASVSVIYGGIQGSKMDHNTQNSMEALILAAKGVFQLLADIVMALKQYWETKKHA